jgi:hypothetical protein
MVNRAEAICLRDRIDDYLEYLLRQWQAIPTLAAEWAEWDKDSKLSWAVDRGVPEDRLAQVERWAAENRLTPAQQSRYAALRALIDHHGPTLRGLLQDQPSG